MDDDGRVVIRPSPRKALWQVGIALYLLVPSVRAVFRISGWPRLLLIPGLLYFFGAAVRALARWPGREPIVEMDAEGFSYAPVGGLRRSVAWAEVTSVSTEVAGLEGELRLEVARGAPVVISDSVLPMTANDLATLMEPRLAASARARATRPPAVVLARTRTGRPRIGMVILLTLGPFVALLGLLFVASARSGSDSTAGLVMVIVGGALTAGGLALRARSQRQRLGLSPRRFIL